MDIEDKKKYAREWYRENRAHRSQQIRARNKEAIERNKKFRKDYLLSHPCVDCGQTNILVLDFDHVRGTKKKEIANMVGDAYSLDSLREEILKCEVRCANCHRIKTHERRNSFNW